MRQTCAKECWQRCEKHSSASLSGVQLAGENWAKLSKQTGKGRGQGWDDQDGTAFGDSFSGSCCCSLLQSVHSDRAHTRSGPAVIVMLVMYRVYAHDPNEKPCTCMG